MQSLDYDIECIIRDDYDDIGWFENGKGSDINFNPSLFITVNSKVSE